jgi:predicted transcriptional regulator
LADVQFTDRELDIMDAHNTVLTMLRILEEKGHVVHHEAGRAHVYQATVEREAASQSALQRMVKKLFRGKPELLLTQLAEDRTLDEATIRRMRELLDERLGGTKP